jgi:signal transduction histidine kinase
MLNIASRNKSARVARVTTNASLQKRNARLVRRARHATGALAARDRELLAVSRKLSEAQETARRHLARELHDDIGQRLTGLNLLLDRTGMQASGKRPQS